MARPLEHGTNTGHTAPPSQALEDEMLRVAQASVTAAMDALGRGGSFADASSAAADAAKVGRPLDLSELGSFQFAPSPAVPCCDH